MAEIPVEKKEKSAFPMWLIPLLLLLLLLPLIWFCSRNTAVVDNTNGNRTVVTTNANNIMANAANGIGNGANAVANSVGNGVNAASNAITVTNTNAGNTSGAANATVGRTIEAVNFFGTTADKQSLFGRAANFRSARVERVLSDKVFTVRSDKEEMFVMLDEKLDSGGGKENQIRVRAGQNVRLTGDFRPVPTQETKDEVQQGNLKLEDFRDMKNQQVYLHATEIGNAP